MRRRAGGPTGAHPAMGVNRRPCRTRRGALACGHSHAGAVAHRAFGGWGAALSPGAHRIARVADDADHRSVNPGFVAGMAETTFVGSPTVRTPQGRNPCPPGCLSVPNAGGLGSLPCDDVGRGRDRRMESLARNQSGPIPRGGISGADPVRGVEVAGEVARHVGILELQCLRIRRRRGGRRRGGRGRPRAAAALRLRSGRRPSGSASGTDILPDD